MKKNGRNDPCICGSGKKFKNCCIEKYKEEEKDVPSLSRVPVSRYDEYLVKYESSHVLNLITGLQLLSGNYGKNVRIEILAQKALRHLSNGLGSNYKELRSILTTKYARHHAEDLPEELFTENVVFHGGNYIVMPGINTHCVDVFNYLTAAIYATQNDLPSVFKRQVNQGISLLLNLGQTLFEEFGLERNIFQVERERGLRFPEKIHPLQFSQHEINAICRENDIDPLVINDFLVDPASVGFDDSEEPTLLYKPIVKYNEEFFFLLPSSQVLAINHYILVNAVSAGVDVMLHDLVHHCIWNDIWRACDKMGWGLTSIAMPPPSGSLPIIEGVFQFDRYMLAYVCYIYPSRLQSPAEISSTLPDQEFISEAINARTREVIASFKGRTEMAGFQFFTLLLTNSMGGFATMAVERAGEGEHKTWFSVFDFLSLAHSNEWKPLSLWKFAKVYEFATRHTQIMATSQVDSYATYKRNGETFYLSDDARHNLLSIVPGDGADIVQEAKKDADVHGALHIWNGALVYYSVKRARTYAPIYKPTQIPPAYTLLLESFQFPLWLQNFQAIDKAQIESVEHIAEAILFWLDKLHPVLQEQLDAAIPVVLHIVLEFEEGYFEEITLDEIDAANRSSQVIFLQPEYKNHVLTIKIPSAIRLLFVGGDNAGERVLLQEILAAMKLIPGVCWTEDFILMCLEKYMPLGPAKMILIVDTRTNLLLDNRWLPPAIAIGDAEVNLLLDRLLGIMQLSGHVPAVIHTVEEKKKFCNQAVSALVKHLAIMLKGFDSERLLSTLIHMHERILHDREFLQLKTSAQIHCFGNNEAELKKILKRERSAVNTSLSMRCLIEFVVLNPSTGCTPAGNDRVEELLAVMNEVLNFGMLSDSIHFKMADPKMGILRSGRIGISKEFFDEKLQPFYKDNILASIDAQLESFEDSFQLHTTLTPDPDADAFLQQIDRAFLADWGASFSCLHGICMVAAAIAERKKSSFIIMSEVEFIEELTRVMPDMAGQLMEGLDKLRFMHQPGVADIDRGYLNKNYFPWKYNREFSFARRPFILLEEDRPRRYCWGMRQCVAASQYLTQLLRNGTLTHGGKEINALLGTINRENGDNFRKAVAAWLKTQSALIVWDFEVTIQPGGHLESEEPLGDCDIFVYDSRRNYVYNIECKKTTAARNIQQMKTEMDAYFGREGQVKKIAKHQKRDVWLQSNLEQVQRFVKAQKPPRVKSLIVTSELIPTRYLKAGELPLPVISFRELRKEGIVILKRC